MLTPYIASSSPNMKSSYEPRMSSPEIDLMNENHLFIDIPFKKSQSVSHCPNMTACNMSFQYRRILLWNSSFAVCPIISFFTSIIHLHDDGWLTSVLNPSVGFALHLLDSNDVKFGSDVVIGVVLITHWTKFFRVFSTPLKRDNENLRAFELLELFNFFLVIWMIIRRN